MEDNIQIRFVEFIDDEMMIGWSSNIGFGQLMVSKSKTRENKYYFATECLGLNYANEILKAAVKYLIDNGEAIE